MIPYSFNPMGVDSYDDLYWLRKIRDANPSSQLPSLWSEDNDPYTQWDGVTWNDEKIRVTQLDVNSKQVLTLQNVNKLTALQVLYCNSNQLTTLDVTGLSALTYLICYSNQLTTLDVSGLTALQHLHCYINQLTTLDVTGLSALKYLYCSYNRLNNLSTLTSKGLINYYNFRYNNFLTSELDRFRALGFTDESNLLPQNP